METSAAAPTATPSLNPNTAYAMSQASVRELARLRAAKLFEVRMAYTVNCGLPADGLTKAQMLSAIALAQQKQIREAVAAAV